MNQTDGKLRRPVFNVLVPVLLIGGVLLLGHSVLRTAPTTSVACSGAGPGAENLQQIRDDRHSARQALRIANADLRRAQAAANRNPDRRGATRRLARATHAQVRATAAMTHQGAVTPTISEAATTSFKLGRDASPGVRTIDFALEHRVLSGPRAVRVTLGRFRPEGGGQELKRGDVKAWARLTPDRSLGTVYVCMKTPNLPSGTFSGEVAFTDPRIARAVVPVSVSRSYPNIELVAFVGLVVCILASMYVFFLRLPKELVDDPDGSTVLRWPFGFFKGYWEFATGTLGVITIVAGGAAAAAAFTAQYLNSDAWTPDIGSWLKYCGAVGTAFVAGGTAGKLAEKSYVKGGQGGAPASPPGTTTGGS